MRQHTDAGFSLVEVLVSLLVLSVGIIGAASMQLTAFRNNQQAGFHSIALQLGTDLADQIRGLAVSKISDASNPFLSLDFKSSDSADTPTALCFGTEAGCDDMALAAFGIHEVQARLKRLLPQGRIKVCRDAMPWDDGSNSFTWDCHAGSSDAPVVVKLGWREPLEGVSAGTKIATTPQLVLLVQS